MGIAADKQARPEAIREARLTKRTEMLSHHRTARAGWLSPKVFLLCLLASSFAVAQSPTLRFPADFSWKGVFDIGLRPKHVPSLERKLTECKDQEMQIVIGSEVEPFLLDAGRLSIELMHDDQVRLLKHTGRVPISMEEGERRLGNFRKMIADHLVRPGSMPPVMDERLGSVMTVSDKHAVAKIGNHVFSFGFTSSFQKKRPLIPLFQLAWVQAPGENSPPIRRKVVEPPEGYEWYSLDPNVHTPDPGEPAGEQTDEQSAANAPSERESATGKDAADADQNDGSKSWLWLAGVILFLALLATLRSILRRKSKPGRDR